jgi:hypothetical protein
MPADIADHSVAKKIHALLLDAHPQRESREIAAALHGSEGQSSKRRPPSERELSSGHRLGGEWVRDRAVSGSRADRCGVAKAYKSLIAALTLSS